MHWIRKHWHRLLIHILAWAPIAMLAGRWLTESLPINLNRYLLLRSGTIGLILLVASLACTVIALVSGWRAIVQVRRPLGLYGFAYGVGHLLVYAILDNSLDLALISRDLGERWSMSIGLAALLLLLPLAMTSTSGWQKRLGMRWKLLHRLVYLAIPLSVLHYYGLDRDIKTTPLIYAVLVLVLLVVRLPPIRQRLITFRQKYLVRRQAAH